MRSSELKYLSGDRVMVAVGEEGEILENNILFWYKTTSAVASKNIYENLKKFNILCSENLSPLTIILFFITHQQ